MGEPAEPCVFCRWAAGAIMDGRYKAGRGGNTVFCLYAPYRQQQPQPSAWSFRKATAAPFSSPLAGCVCRAHTCTVCEPGRAGCLLTRCRVRVPSEQISESLDLGIIAGASVSVQSWVCDPGRDMTLMFDEACCWWIWCSCRPVAGSLCSCLLFTQM